MAKSKKKSKTIFKQKYPDYIESFIKKVEREENTSLSVFRLTNVKMIELSKDKFVMVYVNSSYPTQQYNEIIYKTYGTHQ
jgi:ribosomal protein L4